MKGITGTAFSRLQYKQCFITERISPREADTAQKMKFSITFTEEILNGKLHILCSVVSKI